MAGPDWDVGEDPATIMVRSRTLHEVRALMYKYRGAVESAVKQGATVKQQAEAEDEKLKAPRGGDDGVESTARSIHRHLAHRAACNMKAESAPAERRFCVRHRVDNRIRVSRLGDFIEKISGA